jgi:putative NADPH-quinone reductase
MEVVILNGSPRGAKSVTGALLDGFSEGLMEGGAKVALFKVAGMKIAPCSGCLSCMHKTRGECVIKDDMALILERVKRADLLVMGTPVYTDTMTAQMKIVMDRFVSGLQPFLMKDDSGRIRHPRWWPVPLKWLLVSTAGFPEKVTFGPLVATFRAEALNAGSDPIAEICVPGSIALQMEQPRLERHRAMLREVGVALARTGRIEADLLDKVNTPPFTMDEYVAFSGLYESWCREKLGMTGPA